MLKKLISYPLTIDLDIDDPQTTIKRRAIIKNKSFLTKIYKEWYEWIVQELPHGDGLILELGSGAGFLDEYISGLITSEVFFCPIVKIVLDGCRMPFADQSLKAIVMIDVFHHLPDSRAFLYEAQRCLQAGGRLIMIEPWVTPWSRIIYKYFHHEPFDPQEKEWCFSPTGPLSGANSALPWIVFERDRYIFEKEFCWLSKNHITIEMPFRYLLSGGISLRSLMPGFSFGLWKRLESFLNPWNEKMGMFAKIVLSKADQR